MIWPTFLKDLRLLWPLALLTAALQAFNTWLSVRAYIQSGPAFGLPPLVQQSGIVPMVSAALLCALLIRQDPPQGERNDWLTRPLPRGRVALTKVAAALAMIFVPIFAIDFGFGLAIGIEPAQALLAGFLRSLYIFTLICLPALGAAAIAGTLGQAIVGAVGLAAVLYFMDSAVIRFDSRAFEGDQYGVLARAAFPLSTAIMGAVALGLQFPLRKQRLTALAAAPFALLAVLTFDPGWPRVIGLDPAMHSGERAQTAGFAISFDEARGPFNHNGDPTLWQLRNPGVFDNIAGKKAAAFARMYPSLPGEKNVYLFLPVRSTGTPAGEVWTSANSGIVIGDRSGAELFSYYAGFDRPFPQTQFGPEIAAGFANGDRLADDAASDLGISLQIPPGLLRLRGDEPVSIEAVFDINFLHKGREAPITLGKQAIPGFGACTLTPPRPGTRSWMVSCLQPRSPPFCVTLNSAERGDWVPSCSALYLPFRLGHMMTGPYPRSPQGGSIPADPDEQLVIQDWRPSGHARRTLRIDNIRLNDWTSAANERPVGPDGFTPPPQ